MFPRTTDNVRLEHNLKMYIVWLGGFSHPQFAQVSVYFFVLILTQRWIHNPYPDWISRRLNEPLVIDIFDRNLKKKTHTHKLCSQWHLIVKQNEKYQLDSQTIKFVKFSNRFPTWISWLIKRLVLNVFARFTFCSINLTRPSCYYLFVQCPAYIVLFIQNTLATCVSSVYVDLTIITWSIHTIVKMFF